MDLRKNSGTVLLVAIIVLMAAEILYLVYQNRQLRQMLEDPTRLLEQTLRAGQSVPPVRSLDVTGAEFSLSYEESVPYTLVLWFAPTCSSCEDNFTFWNEIDHRRDPENLRIVGFCACTAPEGRDAAAAHDLEYPVVAVTEPMIVDLYKGNLLPQTILIAPNGLIVEAWPGALMQSQKNEILSLLLSLETIKPEGGE